MTSLDVLKAEYRHCDQEVSAIRAHQRDLATEHDRLAREQRPNYPTEPQRLGLVEALRIISTGEAHGDHLGGPTLGTYDVVTSGYPRQWISVRHNAPYALRSGNKLWDFTDEEVEAFFAIAKHHGYNVVDSWKHVDGVSLIVRPINSQEA